MGCIWTNRKGYGRKGTRADGTLVLFVSSFLSLPFQLSLSISLLFDPPRVPTPSWFEESELPGRPTDSTFSSFRTREGGRKDEVQNRARSSSFLPSSTFALGPKLTFLLLFFYLSQLRNGSPQEQEALHHLQGTKVREGTRTKGQPRLQGVDFLALIFMESMMLLRDCRRKIWIRPRSESYKLK